MSLLAWHELTENVNGRTVLGQAGVRDPDGACEEFDGAGYDGSGSCSSDGHYLCAECSHLSPTAPRFEEYGRDGRADRLRLYWSRPRATHTKAERLAWEAADDKGRKTVESRALAVRGRSLPSESVESGEP